MTERIADSDLAGPTDVQRELFVAAYAVRACERGEIDAPEWSAVRRFQWPFYVPEPVRRLWSALPIEARLAAYIAAGTEAEGDDDRCAGRFDQEFRDYD